MLCCGFELETLRQDPCKHKDQAYTQTFLNENLPGLAMGTNLGRTFLNPEPQIVKTCVFQCLCALVWKSRDALECSQKKIYFYSFSFLITKGLNILTMFANWDCTSLECTTGHNYGINLFSKLDLEIVFYVLCQKGPLPLRRCPRATSATSVCCLRQPGRHHHHKQHNHQGSNKQHNTTNKQHNTTPKHQTCKNTAQRTTITHYTHQTTNSNTNKNKIHNTYIQYKQDNLIVF